MRRDIPREQWSSFLDSFSMQHDHWLVSVESESAATKIDDAALEGIMARDTTESRGEVIITVGGSTETHERIAVDAPSRIAVESENGVESALLIEDERGKTTRVAIRTPVRPELVDGIGR